MKKEACTAYRLPLDVLAGNRHPGCLGTFCAMLDIELDSLAFGQGLETITADCRKMHEYILAAI